MLHSLPPINWIPTARKWPQEPLPVRVGNFWDLDVVFDSYFPGIPPALTVETQRGHFLLASCFLLPFVVPYITCVFLALRPPLTYYRSRCETIEILCLPLISFVSQSDDCKDTCAESYVQFVSFFPLYSSCFLSSNPLFTFYPYDLILFLFFF